MSDQVSLILGPSNAGKTALIASFFYAAGVFSQEGLSVHVQPENETTRNVQKNTLSFLQTGKLPFGGTYSIMEYDFLFSVERECIGWKKIWKKRESAQRRFQFFDSPGGAVFSATDEEIDYTIQGDHRKKLVETLKNAEGLIICVDAAEENGTLSKEHMSGRLYNYLNDIFSLAPKVQNRNGLPSLGIKRVYICLNKCDLWAVQEGWQGTAEISIEQKNPLKFAYQLLGTGFFNTLQTWFSDETQIAFGFSSAYGFLEGGPNTLLLGQVGMGDALRREQVEAWEPYQVLDPFVFLTTGSCLTPAVYQGTVQELRDSSLWKV